MSVPDEWNSKMTVVSNRTAIIVIVGILTLLFLWVHNKVPLYAWRTPICRLVLALEDDFQSLGLRPPKTVDEYYSSAEGSCFRCFKGKFRVDPRIAHRPLWVENLRISVVESGDAFRVKATGDVIKPKWIFGHNLMPNQVYHAFPIGKKMAGKATSLLLTCVSAGSNEWTRRSMGRSDPLVVGAKSDPIPPISFVLPANNSDLVEYKKWLVRVSGPWERFQDDWGHEIRLTLSPKPSPRVLTVQSAGPDGKWNNGDDLLVCREVKTGRVLKTKNLSRN